MLTFLTFHFRVSGVTRRAVAERLVVDDRALGVDAALARVDAHRVVARLVQRALLVGFAAHLDGLGWWKQKKKFVRTKCEGMVIYKANKVLQIIFIFVA